MTRWTWIAAGAMTAAAVSFMLWSGPVGSVPLPGDRLVTPAGQPLLSVDESRSARQRLEADHLQLHRHLQQLMRDRRQYRNDLDAGAPAGRLQAQREAIKRDLKLVRQVRLRIQENSRSDRYSRGQGPRHPVRYFR